MKNVLKLIGIIAFTAIIGFSFAACGGGDSGSGGNLGGGGEKTLSGIAITNPPTKTVYNIGETFDPAGLVVTATYDDDTTEAVTGYSTSGFNSETAGNKIIVVTYQEKTAEFTVNVIDPTLETVATPTASPAGGTYATTQSVTLTTTTGGATIYYTTNDTEPTTGSTPYTTPISISVTTTLKAFAVKAGMNDSAIMTAEYTISSGTDPGTDPGQGTKPTITTSGLTNGTVGIPYSFTLQATGDTPITWFLSEDTPLPAGLELSSAGVISGKPTTAGALSFNAKATNAAGEFIKAFVITIDSLPALTSIADFITWLNGKPINTAATAYGVKLSVADLGNAGNSGSVGNALLSNSGKYVSLDLSDSTMTSFANNFFAGAPTNKGCDTITSITIPNTLTVITNNDFTLCNNLAEINAKTENTAYASLDGVLYNNSKTTLVMYPAAKKGSTFTPLLTVTSIGNYAFKACNNLTSVTIPTGASIGDYAFQSCLYLTSVTIPSNVSSIGASAFSGCILLDGVTIPNITTINNGTFQYCSGLNSITIPASVTSIGTDAFSSCERLTSVIFQRADTTITNDNSFPSGASLRSVYPSGGIGTYTRTDTTWTKAP
jgi:hypothetical protein